MSFMEAQTVSTPNRYVPRHWQADEHAHWWQSFFFWWMGTWISEKIEELFQKHEEMWKHAKGGDQELWLAKLFVSRKCDHPYDKWPGMKGPVLVIIPGTICILQPCPEVSQLATYPGQATWLQIETSTRPVFRPLEGKRGGWNTFKNFSKAEKNLTSVSTHASGAEVSVTVETVLCRRSLATGEYLSLVLLFLFSKWHI